MENVFFHGVEVDDVASLLVLVSEENGSTIALVGVDPDGPAGMRLVKNAVDAAVFGPSVFDGRTIPHALDAIQAQGNGQVVVINCYNPATHLVAVVAEAVDVDSNYVVPFAHVPVGGVVLSSTGGSVVVLVPGVDYTYNEGDKFATILTRRTYGVAADLTADYSYFNPTLVAPADIIGGISAGGIRTGIALLDLVYSTLGMTPKLLIAPTYVEQPTVLSALLLQATKLRARVLVDAPQTETLANAVASRGPAGDYANFFTENKRQIGCFPYLLKPDPLDTSIVGRPFPYSAYLAGIWANSINVKGCQRSPSNQAIAGVTAPSVPLSCGIGDTTSDVAQLNAAGIMTIMGAYGMGLKTWGNRTMSFPADGGINSFASVALTQDIIDESVQIASMAFQDWPLNQALIDTILDSVNSFLNGLALAGTIISGSATYNPALNTAAQLATGQLIISMDFLPPANAEHIIFQSFINTSLYSQLG